MTPEYIAKVKAKDCPLCTEKRKCNHIAVFSIYPWKQPELLSHGVLEFHCCEVCAPGVDTSLVKLYGSLLHIAHVYLANGLILDVNSLKIEIVEIEGEKIKEMMKDKVVIPSISNDPKRINH